MSNCNKMSLQIISTQVNGGWSRDRTWLWGPVQNNVYKNSMFKSLDFLFGQQWLKILLWKAENKSLRILKTEVINSQISKRLHLHYEQAVGSWSNQVHGTQEKLLSLSLTLWDLLANYFTEKSNTTRTARRHFILMIDYFTLHNICRLNFFTR